MKKNLLFVFSLLSFFMATAQITVNRTDLANPGDWFRKATDSLPDATKSASLKVGGSNQNWDITGWVHQHTKDTTFYADGNGFPDAPVGCNLVSYTIDPITKEQMADFLVASSTALKVMFKSGDLGPIDGQLKMFQFPSTMGTTFKDSLLSFTTMLATDLGMPSNPLFDSVRINFAIRVSSLIDGFGKLKIYAGTFDVLRQKVNQNVDITLKIRNKITGTYSDLPTGTGGSFNEATVSYSWVAANQGEPLLTASEDTLGNITEVSFILASKKGLSSGILEHKMPVSTRVYPNPASENITIETQLKQRTTAQMSVFDILGNEVMPSREVVLNQGVTELPVEVNQLKAGIYFYTLSGNGLNHTNRFVIK